MLLHSMLQEVGVVLVHLLDAVSDGVIWWHSGRGDGWWGEVHGVWSEVS